MGQDGQNSGGFVGQMSECRSGMGDLLEEHVQLLLSWECSPVAELSSTGPLPMNQIYNNNFCCCLELLPGPSVAARPAHLCIAAVVCATEIEPEHVVPSRKTNDAIRGSTDALVVIKTPKPAFSFSGVKARKLGVGFC